MRSKEFQTPAGRVTVDVAFVGSVWEELRIYDVYLIPKRKKNAISLRREMRKSGSGVSMSQYDAATPEQRQQVFINYAASVVGIEVLNEALEDVWNRLRPPALEVQKVEWNS